MEELNTRLSFSQLNHECGYQLKYHRERAPQGPQGINLAYGTAVHKGIEYWLTEPALVVIDAVLHAQDWLMRRVAVVTGDADPDTLDPDEISDFGRGLRWDDPPRLTKAGQPYMGDEGKIPDLATALPMLASQIRSWIDANPTVKAKHVEWECDIDLAPLPGWSFRTVLDIITEDGGIIDLKTAAKSWEMDPAKADYKQKTLAKFRQARVYQWAYFLTFGEVPTFFEFQVLVKGTTDVQIIRVPYDREATIRYFEHVLVPQAKAIAAGIFIPRTDGWWCSERWCDWWNTCPLGASANPVPELVAS